MGPHTEHLAWNSQVGLPHPLQGTAFSRGWCPIAGVVPLGSASPSDSLEVDVSSSSGWVTSTLSADGSSRLWFAFECSTVREVALSAQSTRLIKRRHSEVAVIAVHKHGKWNAYQTKGVSRARTVWLRDGQQPLRSTMLIDPEPLLPTRGYRVLCHAP